jgi:hypothetical protein
MFLLRFTDKVSRAHKRMGKTIVSFFNLYILIEDEKTKDSELNKGNSYISTPKGDE